MKEPTTRIIKVRFIDKDNSKHKYDTPYYVRVFNWSIKDFVEPLKEILKNKGIDWYKIECEYTKEYDKEKILNIPTFLKYVDYNIICGIDIPEYKSEYM